MKNQLLLLSAFLLMACSHAPGPVKRVPSSLAICGMKGSIENRIADCVGKGEQSSGSFILVMRTPQGKVVYKDLISTLLWSDRKSSNVNYLDAHKACESNLELGLRSWRIPTVQEFQEAEYRKIRNHMTGFKYVWYWSGGNEDSAEYASVFDGGSGKIVNDYRFYEASVRCVVAQ